MSFSPALEPPDAATPVARWFLFRDGRIALDADLRPPEWSAPEAARLGGVDLSRAHYLGRYEGMDCWAAELEPGSVLPAGIEPMEFREAMAARDDEFFRVASQASQLLTWASTHRHCGRCGAATSPAPGERAMTCPSCGLLSFPRISPAVIVCVLKGDEILLARAHRFPPGMYSVLAGFVEAGESLEECAHREIREETGVEVRGLRYFGSQSWPFPHSLMVAFTARYRSGDLRAEERELADARWFGRDSLPDLPLKASIARRMIEWYRAGAQED